MQLFFAENINGQNAILDRDESRHCQKVLRHRPGDQIHTIDGKGNMHICRIESFEQDHTRLKILDTHPQWGESAVMVRLAVSPLRLKDRFEWLIEKSVELGVNEIYPVVCERTDKYKSKFKHDRIEKLILTALKQSKRSKLPRLFPVMPLKEFLTYDFSGIRLIGYCEETLGIQVYNQKISASLQQTIFIGPEGDFTDEEVKLAQENGFVSVSLGDNRLRTETAGVYALSIFKMLREG